MARESQTTFSDRSRVLPLARMFLPANSNSEKIMAKPSYLPSGTLSGTIFMGGNGVRKSEVKGEPAREQPGTTR